MSQAISEMVFDQSAGLGIAAVLAVLVLAVVVEMKEITTSSDGLLRDKKQAIWSLGLVIAGWLAAIVLGAWLQPAGSWALGLWGFAILGIVLLMVLLLWLVTIRIDQVDAARQAKLAAEQRKTRPKFFWQRGRR